MAWSDAARRAAAEARRRNKGSRVERRVLVRTFQEHGSSYVSPPFQSGITATRNELAKIIRFQRKGSRGLVGTHRLLKVLKESGRENAARSSILRRRKK